MAGKRAGERTPTLERLRREMDRVNRELLSVLQRRARLAARIGAWKRRQGLAVEDPARERAMEATLLERPGRGFARAELARILRAVFAASRRHAIGVEGRGRRRDSAP